MTHPTNRFARGSGAYHCRSCNRRTRSTGRGDNELVHLCAQCYDLAGEENHLSDYGRLYSKPEEVLRLIAELDAMEADTDGWADLKATAQRLMSATEEAVCGS